MTAPWWSKEDEERVARAMWRFHCEQENASLIREGRTPPVQWHDPWHPSGTGIPQQKQYLEQARAALAAMPGGWRDIATAPHDAPILLRHNDWRPFVGEWHERTREFVSDSGHALSPTEWAPLPATPTAGATP